MTTTQTCYGTVTVGKDFPMKEGDRLVFKDRNGRVSERWNIQESLNATKTKFSAKITDTIQGAE